MVNWYLRRPQNWELVSFGSESNLKFRTTLAILSYCFTWYTNSTSSTKKLSKKVSWEWLLFFEIVSYFRKCYVCRNIFFPKCYWDFIRGIVTIVIVITFPFVFVSFITWLLARGYHGNWLLKLRNRKTFFNHVCHGYSQIRIFRI